MAYEYIDVLRNAIKKQMQMSTPRTVLIGLGSAITAYSTSELLDIELTHETAHENNCEISWVLGRGTACSLNAML